jgi:O-antigen ligase
MLKLNEPVMSEGIWFPAMGKERVKPVRPGAVSEPRLNASLLVQISLCVLPAMALIGFGKPATGARWFYPVLLVLLARHLLLKDRFGFATLIVGTIPALMILRNFFYYSSVTVFLGTGVLLWILTAPREFAQLWANIRLRWLISLGGLYWLSSAYLTKDYAANLRVMELVFCIASLYLLVNRWDFLATALLGIGISVIAMGFAFLPYGDRLGAGLIDGYSLGNPISFGIPLTLIFILSIADDGRWLLLDQHRFWRLAITLISGGLLLLSTSRGSWAIVAVNVLILGVINRKQRKTLAALIVLLVVISALLLTSSRGEYVQQSFERTVSSERTLSSSTSGRSDQWWLFPEVLADSPLWGFGPGRGTAIYARYSNLYNIFHSGEGMAWHSLYLQVGIETGIIGMLALTMLVGPLLVRGIAHWRAAGNSVPLHGVVSFIVIALSVSGLDAASAVFLGLGFLSDNWHPPQAPVPAGSAALECCYSECSCAASFLVWERTVGRTTRKLS